MSSDIDNMVSKCETCLKYQRNNQHEPLKQHPVPERVWSKVGVDLFEFNGKNYILGVDYYSKYPVVRMLHGQTSTAVVQVMKSWFAEHGIPEYVMSDNGPCYSSREFKKFSESWEFTHVTSSPRYARSNGQIERTVQTVKGLMKKSSDPELALLEYRNTPIDGVGISPAQMMMSRRTTSILPVAPQLLKPEAVKDVSDELKSRQIKQKYYHDRYGKKELKQLMEGEAVRVRDGKQWEPVIVRQQVDSRSYMVESPDGKILRRNRHHLLHTGEKPFEIHHEVDVEEPVSAVPQPTSTPRKETRRSSIQPAQSPPPPASSAIKASKPAPPGVIITKSGRVSRPRQILDM